MGVGHTAEEAIADAVSGAQLGTKDIPAGERRKRDRYGDLIEVHFVAQRCTRALFEHAEKNGGAGLSWGENDHGLQDLQFFSRSEIDFVLDYIIEVVKEAHQGGGDHPSTWSVEEALESCVGFDNGDENDAERTRLLAHPEMAAIIRAELADWIESQWVEAA